MEGQRAEREAHWLRLWRGTREWPRSLRRTDTERSEEVIPRDRLQQHRVPEADLTFPGRARLARDQDPLRGRHATTNLGKNGAPGRPACAEIVIRDDGVEVGGDLRDCIGGVDCGDDVEPALQHAFEAPKNESIVLDEQDP